MPAKLDPIDAFLRDYGKWFQAPRVDVQAEMRVRLAVMLGNEREGVRRDRIKEETAPPRVEHDTGVLITTRPTRLTEADLVRFLREIRRGREIRDGLRKAGAA